jgi:P27 family predicted phage terminase small subunit
MRSGGPKPIPATLKLLRGNPGRRPVSEGMRPEQHADIPDPPPFIKGYAADEWYSIATELHRLGVLTKVDTSNLAAYCFAYGTWRDAAEMIALLRDREDVSRGLLVRTSYGDAATNPLIGIARRAAADMIRFGAEFGLTPAARARIGGGVNGDEDVRSKFDGLLAR